MNPSPSANLVPVTDPDDPRVAPYRHTRDAALLSGDVQTSPGPCFMAEGLVVVEQMLRSNVTPASILVAENRLDAVRHAIDAMPASTPVYVAAPRVMDEIAGFPIHRGLLALGLRPPSPPLTDLLTPSPEHPAGVRTFVVCENLANHDNLGLIFRSTAALAGPHAAVLLSPGCADPLYRKSLRVSVGCALAIPHLRLDPWPGGLSDLEDAGVRILALATTPEARPLADVAAELAANVSRAPHTPPVAVLVGAEGPGLSETALARATDIVRIPMWDGVDSLNVGVATSIALASLAVPSTTPASDP